MALVVAIMSFLACLTVGGVSLVGQSAATWQSQISREATVQIRPARDFDIETALAEALAVAGIDLLSEELAPAQPGKGRVMAVLGKAGSGKTLLLSELTRALVAAVRSMREGGADKGR